MNSHLRQWLPLFVLFSFASGCDGPEPSTTEDGSCAGAKCDAFGDDEGQEEDEAACPRGPMDLVLIAEEWILEDVPEYEFADPDVELGLDSPEDVLINDLNHDGQDDLVVPVRIMVEGNLERAIFFTPTDGCQPLYVGHILGHVAIDRRAEAREVFDLIGEVRIGNEVCSAKYGYDDDTARYELVSDLGCTP